jgi:hypothetical protein
MDSTGNHEAAHAVGFIAATGRVPLEVRVDRPDLEIAGRCTIDLDNAELECGHLIGTLMGPLAEGEVIHWPPSKDATGDERAAALLVEHLELSKGQYRTALALADHLLTEHQTRRMHALIAQGLSRVPVLSAAQLRELLGPHILERFDIEGATPE